MVLRAHGSVSVPGARLHLRRGLHDRGASDPRLGAAGRSEPPAARAERQGGRTQSAHRRVRVVVRAECVVLRVGGCGRTCSRRPRSLIEQNFGRTLTVGVEEEVMILDPDTFEPAPRVQTLVEAAEGRTLPGVLKMELHAAIVELATEISATAEEAVERLAALRRAASELAERNGLLIAAAGSHPTAVPGELEI